MECPFGCSHHTFPDRFNFCPYCGSKLVTVYDKKGSHAKNAETYRNSENKGGRKKAQFTEFLEIHGLLEGD
jgi:hypothetical protein